ncbi:histidine triad nucleotide-binding protein [Nocardioides fonticola]|uniref:histidine triad nucleotide-binding protein n=1 Tax=Nocardioides fonticola TaxID=450363 RepID=UPI0031DE19D9
MSAPVNDCLFCKIVAGEIPGQIVHTTERSIAFRDINPQAPTHVLVVPREHHENVGELGAADPAGLADLVAAAGEVARLEGLAGYRLIFNTGRAGGQTVFHAHGHVLGGKNLDEHLA